MNLLRYTEVYLRISLKLELNFLFLGGLNIDFTERDVICRLYNKDRDEGSKGIEGLGIERMVTYSTSDNFMYCGIGVYPVYTDLAVNNLFTVFSRRADLQHQTVLINTANKEVLQS